MYLNAHSRFSLNHGVLAVEELVALAKSQGVKQLALTDIHSSSACYDFVRACRKAEIDPVVGMEFRRGDELLYLALARNLQGFAEINAFYSRYAQEGRPFPELPPSFAEVFVVYPWDRREVVGLAEHEFLGVRPDQVRQIVRSRYRHRQEKLVILQPIIFADAQGYQLHRVLRAIAHNSLIGKLKTSQHAHEDAYFVAPDQLREAFKAYPAVIANTERLLHACSFNFIFGQRRTKHTFTGGNYDDVLLLEKLAREGLRRRYGSYHPQATKRLETELEVIDQLDFSAYFLITWDFVRYGQSRGFYHVGRGSGANSIVAYCLGITDVDPIELNLYFERFLNPKRTSPPDFDIDYSWRDRDEVLDYVLKRYQGSHAVLLASYQTYQERGALREVGKVFGLPKQDIDILAALGLDEVSLDELTNQVHHFARMLVDFPRHLSIHAGGVLISEAPIHHYTAIDLPPKGMPISHFDMHVAEEIGLHKFDILSQRGLGHIREAVERVRIQSDQAIDIHDTQAFKRDPKVLELLKQGETTGCFYVESPAMKGLLRKLGCDNYLTLVAASSVIRPGVARSGMMRTFIERHRGKLFSYPHPTMAELLQETYGVMVYQEDVLKMIHGFAGLDLAEADLIRRAMSGKASESVFEQVEARFVKACLEKGYELSLVKEVWRQIQSFAGYSFSKAHSASYAIESLQSLYLKAHHPLAFMVAVINNEGGFYQPEFYLHEARRWGAKVHAPDINRSHYLSSLEGNDLYLGFRLIKGIAHEWAEAIAGERETNGPFRSLADFRFRLDATEPQLSLLIRAGAFRFTGISKPALLWEAKTFRSNGRSQAQRETLFAIEGAPIELPLLADSELEDAYDEMELLGFPLCSPFSLLETSVPSPLLAKDFSAHLGKKVCLAGYFICAKTVKTVKGERMQFANFVDQAGEFFDVTIFPREVKQCPLRGPGVYVLTGTVTEDFGVYSLELVTLEKERYLPDPREKET